VILFLALAESGASVFADAFYVNCYTGSDETGDGSEGNPWKTLQHAFDSIEGTEANPHDIYLSEGIYDLPGSYITPVKPDSYENVIGINPERTYIYNIWFDSIDSCSLSNLKTTGFAAHHSQNISLQNCHINYSMNLTDCTFLYSNCLFYKIDDIFWWITDSEVLIRNSIIYKCNKMFQDETSPDLTVEYSLVEFGWPGTGNIQGDPLFIDPDAFDFRLRQASPCIDAGDPASPVPPGGGNRIDMGLYEYPHTPQLYFETVTFNEPAGDGDGIPERGETIRPALCVYNYGEPATGLEILFELDHPDAAVTDPIVNLGDMIPGQVKNVDGAEFIVTDRTGWCIPVELSGSWTSGADTGTVSIQFSLHGVEMHIDPVSGSDKTGTGSPENPFKTIGSARDAAGGSRFHRVTLRPHAGIYSEDSGEGPWPVWTDEFEDLRGDGPETEIWNRYCEETTYMFFFSHTSDVSDLALQSEFRNVAGFKVWNGQDVVYDHIYSDLTYGHDVSGKSTGYTTTTLQNSELRTLLVDYAFLESTFNILNNTFDFVGFSTNVSLIGNTVIDGGTIGSNLQPFPENVVTDNDFQYILTIRNAQVFERNHSNGVFIYTNEDFSITGNTNRGCFATVESNGKVTFVNNIGIPCSDQGVSFQNVYSTAPSLINCSHVPLRINDQHNGFFGDHGAFDIDGCLSMFCITGIDHEYCLETRNSCIYYNLEDNSDCVNTEYSNLVNCPGPTNIDADPQYIGIGEITDIGDRWFTDDTAAWEPGRYAGYYVNPNIFGNDELFYCIGNTEDTIYLSEPLEGVAYLRDRYVIPDIRLRRIADGFMQDSPLIDAGDPAQTDPDGSRRDIGPYGGPYARTPLPAIPTWPPPNPVTRETGVELEVPQALYHPGDQFWCNASVFIRDTVPLYHHSLWVILDVYGDLFFAPSFNSTGDAWPGPWIPGETLIPVLEPFTWPDTGTSASGIWWYAALTNPEVTEIYGEWDSFEFGWE